MGTTVGSTAYEVSETKVRFLEITAVKKEGLWEYSETGAWFKKRPIGTLYTEFSAKVESLKNDGRLLELDKILCSAACATELLIHGFITKQMIASIEEKVAGQGGGMVPMVCIPKQDVMLAGIFVQKVSIIIVDCHSYKGYCFIDKNNKDM